MDPDTDNDVIQSASAPINPIEFFDGNDRVLSLMNMRRNGSDAIEKNQQRADAIKATLCNKIHELVRSVPGLRDRIIAISNIDPELSAYIMALESINSGIWCPSCKIVKSFGAPTSTLTAAPTSTLTAAPTSTPTQNSLEISKLQAHLRTARENLALLTRENAAMKDRMELITIKLDSYNNRLNAITPTIPGVAPPTMPRVAPPTAPPTVPSTAEKVQATPSPFARMLNFKKEDLPPAPELDISFTLGESSSADSILE